MLGGRDNVGLVEVWNVDGYETVSGRLDGRNEGSVFTRLVSVPEVAECRCGAYRGTGGIALDLFACNYFFNQYTRMD